MSIEITRPEASDFEEIKALFMKTLEQNFREEGILESHPDDLEEEIQLQIERLEEDLRTDGKEAYYLLAKVEHKIVGTIARGALSQTIVGNLEKVVLGLPEIKSVYILPEFQGKGIGSMLLSKMMDQLIGMEIYGFYLDCGYTKAQGYWNKKLGKPISVLKDYWGAGLDHMIWHYRMDKA